MDIPGMKKQIKKQKEMTQQEAFDLIQQWGEDLEVRLVDEDFEAVQKEIWMAVVKERLTFNESDEIFTYALKKPIQDKEGNNIISIVKIRETDMQKKKGLKKHKDEMDTLAALFSAYCTDTENNEIAHGFITRIKDRDINIISAVILGFFVQAVPGVS